MKLTKKAIELLKADNGADVSAGSVVDSTQTPSLSSPSETFRCPCCQDEKIGLCSECKTEGRIVREKPNQCDRCANKKYLNYRESLKNKNKNEE